MILPPAARGTLFEKTAPCSIRTREASTKAFNYFLAKLKFINLVLVDIFEMTYRKNDIWLTVNRSGGATPFEMTHRKNDIWLTVNSHPLANLVQVGI
jgi:hypothetical protein